MCYLIELKVKGVCERLGAEDFENEGWIPTQSDNTNNAGRVIYLLLIAKRLERVMERFLERNGL